MICQRCENDTQPEDYGSPRKCAFINGEFTPNNWNCGTMRILRNILGYEKWDSCEFRQNDSSLGVIPFIDEADHGMYAVLSWYKNRGCTLQAYIMSDDDPPRPLTLKDAETIIEEYKMVK